jgi:hypothetical protein
MVVTYLVLVELGKYAFFRRLRAAKRPLAVSPDAASGTCSGAPPDGASESPTYPS